MFRQEDLLFLVNKILLWGDSTGNVVADLFTDMNNPDIWCDFLSLKLKCDSSLITNFYYIHGLCTELIIPYFLLVFTDGL